MAVAASVYLPLRQSTLASLCWRVIDGFLHRAHAGRADVAVAVGGDAHADARGAGEDAEIIGAIGDVAGDEVRVVGVIDRAVGVGAEVMDVMADGLEVGDDGVFEIEGAVIGSDGDAEGGMAHGRAGIQDRENRIGNRKFRLPAEMDPESAATNASGRVFPDCAGQFPKANLRA